MEEVKEIKDFKLPNKTVKVVPLIKPTSFIPNVNHVAAHTAPRAKKSYVVPLHRNGNMANVLNDAEKEFFEDTDRSGLSFSKGDLSVYKKPDSENFWKNFEVELDKDTVTLDLSNPMDYMKYKLLLLWDKEIAKNKAESSKRSTYKYYLIDQDEEMKYEIEEASIEERAWELFSEVKRDRAKMIEILSLYGKKVDERTTSDDFMIAELRKIMKKTKSEMIRFIETIEDEDFDYKVMIEKAVRTGALNRNRNNYFLPEGDLVASNTPAMIKYLKDAKNQDTYMLIEERIKNAN